MISTVRIVRTEPFDRDQANPGTDPTPWPTPTDQLISIMASDTNFSQNSIFRLLVDRCRERRYNAININDGSVIWHEFIREHQ